MKDIRYPGFSSRVCSQSSKPECGFEFLVLYMSSNSGLGCRITNSIRNSDSDDIPTFLYLTTY